VYMLLYGQTWYQKYFNATAVQISDQIVHLSRTLRKKPKMNWHTLWSEYLQLGFPDDTADRVKQKYDAAQSWHEFFESIKSNNCITWYEWVSLLTKTLARGTTITGSIWHISLEKYNATCTITKIEKLQVTLTRPTYVQRRLFGGRTRK